MSCCIGFGRSKRTYSFHSPYESASGTYRGGRAETVQHWQNVEAENANNAPPSNGEVRPKDNTEYQAQQRSEVIVKKDAPSPPQQQDAGPSQSSDIQENDAASIHSSEKDTKDNVSTHSSNKDKISHHSSDKDDKDSNKGPQDEVVVEESVEVLESNKAILMAEKEHKDEHPQSADHDEKDNVSSHSSEHNKAETASCRSEPDNISTHSDKDAWGKDADDDEEEDDGEMKTKEVIETLEKFQQQREEEVVTEAEDLETEQVERTIEEVMEAPTQHPIQDNAEEAIVTEQVIIEVLSPSSPPTSTEESDNNHNEQNEGHVSSVEVNMDDLEMRSGESGQGTVVHVNTPVELVY